MRRTGSGRAPLAPVRPAPENARLPTATVNGTELYHEVRGTGPPVLLIMGATGDGGHFDALADLLADEFTVISYDRRGNGRSPAPAGWETTSPEEQADDAAALLDALGTGPAAIFGTSSGGNHALCLMVRYPASVRGVIMHDPGVYALADDFDAVRAPVRALVQEAMGAGGPPAAVERFWGYMAGEAGWNRLAPALRDRLRATANTLFAVELGTYELYLPDDETLAAILPRRCSCSSARTALPSLPRSPAGSASALASRLPPRRVCTTRITSTPRSWRRPCGHSCARPALVRCDLQIRSVPPPLAVVT